MGKLEHSEWADAYEAGWKAALSNRQAESVGRRFETFKHSDEAAKLKKQVKQFKQAIHDNVEVSDVPEEWQHASNNLRITVHNHEEIEAAGRDVEETERRIMDSRPVRNLGSSLERWGKSDEVAGLKKLDKKFWKSQDGQELAQEWGDVFRELDQTVMHNDNGIYIDNERMPYLSDELEDVGNKYHSMKDGKWDRAYKKAWGKALDNRQAHSVGRRWESFKASDEGQEWKGKMKTFGKTVERNVEVTDVPDSWKKDMFLF